MSKKWFLIFAAGAVAGWTSAKRLFGETQSWATSGDTFDKGEPTPMPLWDSRPEPSPARPVVTGVDPFRGAFAGALAEVESHTSELEDPDTEVA